MDWGALALLSRVAWLRRLLCRTKLLGAQYDCEWPGKLLLRDCRRPLPFTDGSVDFIYTSHFIEHLRRSEAEKLLRECHRVLKPSGVIRVVVPDLKLLATKYLTGDRTFFASLDGQDEGVSTATLADFFAVHFYGFHCEEAPAGLLQRLKARFIRGHLWMYDSDSLSVLMNCSGFAHLRKCLPCEGSVPDIERLDVHPDVSLHIEGVKVNNSLPDAPILTRGGAVHR